MTSLDVAIIVGGGFAAGVFNTAFAGGGLVSFLALAYVGVPPLVANAVNLLVMPSSFLAVLPRLRLTRHQVRMLLAPAVGTVTGALLATKAHAEDFASLAPWLVLAAAVLLVAQPTLARVLSGPDGQKSGRRLAGPRAGAVLLCGSGLYAGFFGVGVGTLVLLVLAVTTSVPFSAANRSKNVVCLATSVVGCVVFLLTGLVRPGLIDWTVAGWLAVGMAVGGVVGTWLASRISELTARMAILGVSAAGVVRLSALW